MTQEMSNCRQIDKLKETDQSIVFTLYFSF